MTGVDPSRGATHPVGVLLAHVGEVPPGDGWLGARERAVLTTLRFPKRRADWRLGRYAAKRAAAGWLGRPTHLEELAGLEILADGDGAPRLHLGGEARVALSLSHRDAWGMAAVASPDVTLGCDLERVEPRSDLFLADYLTPREQALVAAGGPDDGVRRATLVWSVKECVLKALREGLRLDTRSVELAERHGEPVRGWSPVAGRAIPDGPVFEGWWRPHCAMLACVLGAPALGAPLLLT